MKKNVHVTPKGDNWQVKTANSSKAYKVVNTQKEAIIIGKNIATNNKSELLIRGKKGQIRVKDSYGYDNFPPKG
jgi:ribosomal protein S20